MNGKEVFRFAGRTVPEAMDAVLKKADMTMEQIDWIVPHQANLRIIDATAKRLGVSEDKVMINIQQIFVSLM